MKCNILYKPAKSRNKLICRGQSSPPDSMKTGRVVIYTVSELSVLSLGLRAGLVDKVPAASPRTAFALHQLCGWLGAVVHTYSSSTGGQKQVDL